jgi:predicted deacylase
MQDLPLHPTGQPHVEYGYVRPTEDVEIPFGIIEGERPGPCLLVTAGVHGSEYCSIEAAIRLMSFDPSQVAGTLIVLPILNVKGFQRRSIYVMPEDGKNLNRMFPGRADGTVSERLANWLVTKIYPRADVYLDLHGGDLSESLAPFSLFPSGCEKSKKLASVFGLPVAVAAGGEGYTINAASKLGIPSLLPEVGGNGLWGEEAVDLMMGGIMRVMHHLGMLAGPAAPAPQPDPLTVSMWVPPAPCSGLWYAKKDLSEPVTAGDVLGEIKDVFGKVLATIRSDRDGFILYRLSSLSVSEGEALLGVGTPLAD